MKRAEEAFDDTRRAFDSIAAEYDGPKHHNPLLQRMRRDLWRTVENLAPPGARLLDLGCGPGIDAVYFARAGYHVTAIDWSPKMVAEARARADAANVGPLVDARVLGIQQLDQLDASSESQFDCIYSDFGPLNCIPDLRAVSIACAERLRPGGALVACVMGRVVPWERIYYTLRGDLERARVRDRQGSIPVGMNGHTVWTAYYTPREFYTSFAAQFDLSEYRGLALFLPPPYLVDLYLRFPRIGKILGRLDDEFAGRPLLRDAGDHFLMTLLRKGPR